MQAFYNTAVMGPHIGRSHLTLTVIDTFFWLFSKEVNATALLLNSDFEPMFVVLFRVQGMKRNNFLLQTMAFISDP